MAAVDGFNHFHSTPKKFFAYYDLCLLSCVVALVPNLCRIACCSFLCSPSACSVQQYVVCFPMWQYM